MERERDVETTEKAGGISREGTRVRFRVKFRVRGIG